MSSERSVLTELGTAWFGAVGVFAGTTTIVAELGGDSAAANGFGLVVAGLLVVILAWLLATGWQEPDETLEMPSGARNWRQ